MEHIDSGKNYSYLIVGDFNSRISNWGLPIEGEEELEDFITNKTELDRCSQDEQFNHLGRKLIELCVTFTLTPLHGLIDRGFPGDFTFTSDRGNSVVDYHLCSLDLLECVCEFSINTRIESDHSPSVAKLLTKETIEGGKIEKKFTDKIVWDPSKTQELCEFFNKEETKRSLEDLNLRLVEGQDANENLSQFQALLQEASEIMKKKICTQGGKRRGGRWFDNECRDAKKRARQALHRVKFKRKNISPVHCIHFQLEYKKLRNEYKALIKKKKI